MSEQHEEQPGQFPITIQPGDKVRTNGQTIKVGNLTIITGEVVPQAEPQKNRHMLLVCSSKACQTWQQQNRGKIQKCRGSLSEFNQDNAHSPMPTCGLCGAPFHFRGEDN